jgi:CxxC-x17-CxxC domain-containing protein
MMYQDKPMTCRECGAEFTFTAGEQEFYAAKGFENNPSRCPSCRSNKKQQRNGYRSDRQMHTVTCAGCGVETEVPFKPSGDRPVYCRNCFQSRR